METLLQNEGLIVKIIGPVIDIKFRENEIPKYMIQ